MQHCGNAKVGTWVDMSTPVQPRGDDLVSETLQCHSAVDV